MKKLLLMLSFGLFVSVACAQSLSNTLLIISPDSARFTVRISGYQVNKTPGSRVVCKGIYLSQAPVQIIFADTTCAPIKTVVSFAPNYKKKINVAPSPMVARYYVYPKKRNSKIKLQSIKNR